MKAKRILTLVLVLMITALALTGCGGSDTDSSGENGLPEKVTIAMQPLTSVGIIPVQEDGFSKMDVTAEVKNFDSGRDMVNALTSDSVDFAMMLGICPTTVGLTSGSDYKIIWVDCLIRDSEGLIVRENSGIKDVRDLKGKKVGVTTASSGHYGLLCALEDAGMSAEDIEIVDLQPDAINSAWQRGDIDAAYTWNPTLINLKNNGGNVLLTGADLAEKGHQTVNFHVVRTEFAEQYPELVKQYCSVLADAAALYESDPDKVYEIVGAYHELSVDETKEQMSDEYVTLENQLSDEAFGNDTIAKNILEVAEFMKEQGEIEDAKDLEFFKNAIDTSYIEALLAEQQETEE